MREHIWLGDTPVAMAMALANPANPPGPPKLYAIHTDQLNTPQVIVDHSNAATRWRFMTEPFGTTQSEQSINGSAAFTQPLSFPGQYDEGEKLPSPQQLASTVRCQEALDDPEFELRAARLCKAP